MGGHDLVDNPYGRFGPGPYQRVSAVSRPQGIWDMRAEGSETMPDLWTILLWASAPVALAVLIVQALALVLG